MFILLKNICTMHMVYTSSFSYNCGKQFQVSRNLLTRQSALVLKVGVLYVGKW